MLPHPATTWKCSLGPLDHRASAGFEEIVLRFCLSGANLLSITAYSLTPADQQHWSKVCALGSDFSIKQRFSFPRFFI